MTLIEKSIPIWKAVWGKTFFSARNVDLSMFLVLLFFKKAN
ncbi:hypothetical protein D348_02706 [Enterococcus faecalis SLO2C-1]|nr:hypothetical protein D348_02706 [Enterococcus faecalis SLO2C-1]